MNPRDEILENHTVVVRDGRILDVVPSACAAERYQPSVHVDRPEHVLLPGLVNAATQIAPAVGRSARPERLHDGAQLCIADMLKNGITCCCATGYFPDESARSALESGMRAVIGLPFSTAASPWAAPEEYLTRALEFRDEYRSHPSIATVFAPMDPGALSDATFTKIATVADEVEAGLLVPLHASRAEIEQSVERHGKRPLARMQALGLVTPALTALHMAHVDPQDRQIAQSGGIALILCPQADMRRSNPPAVSHWLSSGLRLGVASGAETGADVWSELKLFALLGLSGGSAQIAPVAWAALAAVTHGAAAALGLDQEIGSLERGKWADVCCVDLRSPAMQWNREQPTADLATQIVLQGGRDTVSDVWVAGRHLLDDGGFTRLDWPALRARLNGRKV